MLEIYIISTIFILILAYIYKKFYKLDYITGEWLIINKDIKLENNIEWDISDKSNIRILNFSSWKKYFFGGELFTSIKNKEGIVLKFEQDCILDIYNEQMENVYHIPNPDLIILANENDPRIYHLDPNKKYIFFARTFENFEFKSKIYKFKNMENIEISGRKKHCQNCYLDEDELFHVFYKKCEEIRNAMLIRDYNLVKIGKSEEYVSFPSNSVSNKLEIECNLGDVLIIVTTNKRLTSDMKNHIIEINSENNSFNWKPEGGETIAHMLLDNCDKDDKFVFYERTTNIDKGSNILPFQVLVFRR